MSKTWGFLTNFEDVDGLSVGEVLERSLELCPEKEAIISGDRRITYEELNRLVDNFAAGMVELGLQKGDRVAIDLPNSPELIIAFYAFAKLGIITTWLNPLYRENELKFILSNSESKGVIVNSNFSNYDYAGVIMALKQYLPNLEFIIDVSNREGTLTFDEILQNGSEKTYQKAKIVPKEDYAMLIYSSGSTGVPKGAPHTHWQVLRQGFNYAEALNATADDIYITFLPLYHLYAFGALLISVIPTQGTMVLMEAFKKEDTFRLIEKEKCTIHHAAPTHYILELSDKKYKDFNLSSLRAGFISGYVPPEQLMIDIEEKLNIYITNFWGSSETGGALICEYGAPRDKRIKTVGKPISIMEIKIVDVETREEKRIGEAGELTTKGPNVIKEYWENPSETAAQFDEGGWYRTGDLAVVDADGYVTIVGRTKDQINRGALKIIPSELEEVIIQHPKIAEVCVVSTPNPVLGESICVCIVPEPGQDTATLSEIRDFLQGKVADNKLPDELSIFQEFPRMVGGVKLNKFAEGGIKELAAADKSREFFRKNK